jgi:hypothetical protein
VAGAQAENVQPTFGIRSLSQSESNHSLNLSSATQDLSAITQG